VNGRAIAPERMDDFNVMVIPVERGSSVIRVWFARTEDRTVGIGVSVIAMMVAIGLIAWGKSRKMENGNSGTEEPGAQTGVGTHSPQG
jgi:hypothetical protein